MTQNEGAESRLRYLWTALACAATTLVATPLLGLFDLANIVMLFLLTVVLVAVRLGRGPAVAAAFLCVALFDFFFVPPRFSFTVNDAQYLLTFAVMLTVALITGHLVTGLGQQAEADRRGGERNRALYEMARALAGAVDAAAVARIAGDFLRQKMGIRSALLVAGDDGALADAAGGRPPPWIEPQLARMAFEQGQRVEFNALSEADASGYYFPLAGPSQPRGVIALEPEGDDEDVIHANRDLLEAVASLTAVALERLQLARTGQETQLQIAAERLRGSVLAALSHDLRTPLTALVGLADSLTLARPPLPAAQAELAAALREQALRISGLVANLLDMARLQAGAVRLRKAWQPLEEVVGASLQLLDAALAGRPVTVSLAPDLPPLEFDAVLLERVFCNLIDNAIKYSPPGTAIAIEAYRSADVAEIAVADRGPGFAAERRAALSAGLDRTAGAGAKAGGGLGLSICKAIVEAHGGSIAIADREGGGARVAFTLPLGEPPAVDDATPVAGVEASGA